MNDPAQFEIAEAKLFYARVKPAPAATCEHGQHWLLCEHCGEYARDEISVSMARWRAACLAHALANPPGPRHGISPENQLPCVQCGAADHTARWHAAQPQGAPACSRCKGRGVCIGEPECDRCSGSGEEPTTKEVVK